MAFWRWVEERIEAAIHAGEFDSLVGRGRPLKIDEDPLAPPEERLSRHIMQNAGVKPAWVELADEIHEQLEAARDALARADTQLPHDDPAWARAMEHFELRVDEINLMIKRYNLMVPNPRLARGLVNPALERQRVTARRAIDS
jgi:hypothetical protein